MTACTTERKQIDDGLNLEIPLVARSLPKCSQLVKLTLHIYLEYTPCLSYSAVEVGLSYRDGIESMS